MDRTSNNTAAWIVGAILVLLVLGAIVYALVNNGTTPSIPNTGNTTPTTIDSSGSGTTY